jgi:hypothetical protein
MADDARQQAFSGPATVAVHDDGDVARGGRATLSFGAGIRTLCRKDSTI